MIVLIVFLICVFICLGIGVLAGASDIRTMTIPNLYSIYVAASFAIAYAAVAFAGVDGVFSSLFSHLFSALLVFAFTFGLFGMGMLGAGDSKFASACALWFSAGNLPVFIVYMACIGGLLAVASVIIQRRKPFQAPTEGSWVAQIQGGASKVPYGVAIALGMGFAFIKLGYFSPGILSSFLPATVEG